MNLVLHLTRNCQLRCSYCYSGHKEADSMSDAVLEAAIKKAFAPSPDTRHKLYFFGGEPLLEWDKLRKADLLYEKTVAGGSSETSLKTLTTNGLLLDDEKLKWLKEHGYVVGFSMDGNRRSHDKYRIFPDGRPSFEQVSEALERLIGSGIPYKVLMTVNPDQISTLRDSFRYFAETGVTAVSLNLNHGARWTSLRMARLGRVYRRIASDMLENRWNIYWNLLHGKLSVLRNGGYREGDRCRWGNREWAVAPSGNIYPCERIVGNDEGGEDCLGNVLDDRLKPPVRSGRISAVPCESCDYRKFCVNWCGCINKHCTGDHNKVGAVQCAHEKVLIDLARSFLYSMPAAETSAAVADL